MTDRLVPTICLAVAMHFTGSASVAEEVSALSRTKYTNGAQMRRAFLDVVASANNWTVWVKSDDKVLALGTIVRADGYVISKASQLHGDLVVRLSDTRELPAEYIGYSADHDVALLKVEADNLETVTWQQASDPQVGGWVITPDQQGAPSSIGVVSVARRNVPRIQEPAILGIRMKVDTSPVLVERVIEDSSAARAGLQENDTIQQVDDVVIDSPQSMKYEISRRSPGDTITLLVERKGVEMTLRATLSHPFGEFQSRIAMQNTMGGALSERRTGFPVVFQHDSVLDPTRCGGPVVDLSGQAIGINIARAGRTETYAIPDDVLVPLIDELISGNYPPPGDQQPTVAADVLEETTASPAPSDTSGR